MAKRFGQHFALGVHFAGVAGVLWGLVIGPIDPMMAMWSVAIGMVAAAVGGWFAD